MSTSYIVSPASGDSTAAIYSSTTMTSANRIGTLSKGTQISVISKNTRNKWAKLSYSASSGAGTGTGDSVGTVHSQSGLNGRTGPGTSYSKICAFINGTKLTIKETNNGWYKVEGKASNGKQVTNVWVFSQYVTVDNAQGYAYISITDIIEQTNSSSSTSSSTVSQPDAEYIKSWNTENSYRYATDTNFNEAYRYNDDKRYASNEDYYKQELSKLNYCFGCPPKYNMDIDIQYVSDIGIGRVMTSTYYSNPTVLSICPGKVKMFPHLFNSNKRNAAFNALYDAARGDTSIAERIMGDKDNDLFNGSLYEFSQDTTDYAKRVNLLCRACAILLGIGDELMPYTSVPLRKFDYTYWSIRKRYSPTNGDSKNENIFTNFKNTLGDTLTSGMTDENYIHFLVSNENTQVSEGVQTNVEDSFLSGIFNSTNTIANQLSFFSSIGFNNQADASENIQNILNGVVGEHGWTKLVDNVLSGGKLKVPQIVGDTNYQLGANCSLTFISPYGNPKSVFLWCIVPICHLYALALPKQLSDSMYSYPYILKVFQKGWFNSDLCVMSSINLTRGGSDGTSWSSQGLATEWTVNFDITPLYSQLTLPSTDHPLLFIQNDGLIDFLGNICAFDLKANNVDVKINLLKSFLINRFTGIPNDVQRWVSDKVYDSVSKIFQM